MGEQVSERDDLARVFMRTVPDHHPDLCDCDPEADTPCEGAYEHADAALAWFAEHRGPRVVSTVEELDALPVGSVVLDNFGYMWQRSVNGLWMNGESIFSSADLMTDEDSGEVVPVTVLFTPTTESEDR